MPTYDYQCTACKYRFEHVQPITSSPLKKCPKCGKKVSRLIGGGGGIIFKGSGFYQTDYRSKGYQDAAQKDSPSKDSDKKPEKTEKPAAKEKPKKEAK